MRLIHSFLLLILLVVGGFVFWNYNHSVGETISSWMHGNNNITTLEARFTPQQILQISKKKLDHEGDLIFSTPSLFFRPYLSMKVRFPGNDGKLETGVLLWSLVDGEAVINGDTWEMTNGFSKTIADQVNSEEEFNLLEVMSQNGGSIKKDVLQQRLKMEKEHLEQVVALAKEKHLITENEGRYFLTFDDSKIDMAPQTHFSEPLVTKVYSHALREQASFDKHQIEAVAVSAFGSTFTVEDSEEIYLPVYVIETHKKNEDGSPLTTYWNGVTGSQLDAK